MVILKGVVGMLLWLVACVCFIAAYNGNLRALAIALPAAWLALYLFDYWKPRVFYQNAAGYVYRAHAPEIVDQERAYRATPAFDRKMKLIGFILCLIGCGFLVALIWTRSYFSLWIPVVLILIGAHYLRHGAQAEPECLPDRSMQMDSFLPRNGSLRKFLSNEGTPEERREFVIMLIMRRGMTREQATEMLDSMIGQLVRRESERLAPLEQIIRKSAPLSSEEEAQLRRAIEELPEERPGAR